MRKFWFIFYVLFFLVFIFSCSTSKKDFETTKEGNIWFRNPGIELQFDPNMNVALFYGDDETPLNVVDKGKPSHFIVVDGKEVAGFAVNYDEVNVESVETEFGKGRKLSVKGVAELQAGNRIEKTLFVELYENYPDVALISASYKNIGKSDVKIDKSISNYFIMDASRANPKNKPYDFWSFQGASLAWGL